MQDKIIRYVNIIRYINIVVKSINYKKIKKNKKNICYNYNGYIVYYDI